MYQCNRCGSTFDSPNLARDFTSEYFGQLVTHYVDVCPSCGSTEIEEMDHCMICGEPIPAGEEICRNCAELIDDFADSVRARLTEMTVVHKLNYNELVERIMDKL